MVYNSISANMINWDSTFVKLRCDISGRAQYRGRGGLRGPLPELVTSDYDLHYYYAGHGTMRLRDGTVMLAPGVCLWLRSGWTYVSTQDRRSPLGHCFLHFDLVNAAGQVLSIPSAGLPPERLSASRVPVTEALTRWVAVVAHGVQIGAVGAAEVLPAAEAALRSLLMALDFTQPGHAHVSSAPAVHPVVFEIIRIIEDNLAAPPTVAALARKSGYSPNYLLRLFRDEFGLSPQQYMTGRRLARAKQLLRHSELTVAHVAAQLGYDDPLYFSRLFRRHTGQSPTDFRGES